MRAICIIPARMASSRFPDKPLATILGMSMIMHVWHRCRLYGGFERVVVATCDEVIAAEAAKHGAESVMTSISHQRATDRTAEAIDNLKLGLSDDDLVVMVQGDEALMTPDMAAAVVEGYRASKAPVVNLAASFSDAHDHDDPNMVKVVAALNGQALYLSRSPIPSRARGPVPIYVQTGVIGFSATFLRKFLALPQTPLEKIESVDMLRVLEHGYPLQLVYTERQAFGVDTPDDLKRAESVLRADPVTRQYLPAAE
jgi:3-deoxy-manno-octulosonate cytidylyltransferase (CMP-KDO synthetase)